MSDVKDYFEVLSIGDVVSGNVSFWRKGTRYYRQCIGITPAIICSKELYDKAKRVYDKQLNGDYSERI